MVQHLISQKRLNTVCRSAANELEKAKKALEDQPYNPIGPQAVSSKEDQEVRKLEKKLILEMVESARIKKFCQRCKTHGGPHQIHNTSNCHHSDKDGKALGCR